MQTAAITKTTTTTTKSKSYIKFTTSKFWLFMGISLIFHSHLWLYTLYLSDKLNVTLYWCQLCANHPIMQFYYFLFFIFYILLFFFFFFLQFYDNSIIFISCFRQKTSVHLQAVYLSNKTYSATIFWVILQFITYWVKKN